MSACHFPAPSALWPQHKSGPNDSPHSAQEDRGANKGLWFTMATPWVSHHWDNAQVPCPRWGHVPRHHVTSTFLWLLARRSFLLLPLGQFWGKEVRGSGSTCSPPPFPLFLLFLRDSPLGYGQARQWVKPLWHGCGWGRPGAGDRGTLIGLLGNANWLTPNPPGFPVQGVPGSQGWLKTGSLNQGLPIPWEARLCQGVGGSLCPS